MGISSQIDVARHWILPRMTLGGSVVSRGTCVFLHSCPESGFVTILNSASWPLKLALLRWDKDLQGLVAAFDEPAWRRAILATGGLDVEVNRLAIQHSIRVPQSLLHRADLIVAALARFNARGQSRVWISASHITESVLEDAAALETNILAQAGALPTMVVRGALAAGARPLLRYLCRNNRTIVPVVDVQDCSTSVETARIVRALAEQGVVCPIDLRLADADVERSVDVCREWVSHNRACGVILTPALDGVGFPPDRFAQAVLRIYEADLLPGRRLFPLNAAIYSLSTGALPAMFQAHPLGLEEHELRSIPAPFSDPPACGDWLDTALASWAHLGTPLPSPGTYERQWLARVVATILPRMIGQCAHELLVSATHGNARKRSPIAIPRSAVRSIQARSSAERTPAPNCHHPRALPHGMAINNLDLDITKRCNLRCVYCFKSGTVQPAGRPMPLRVAKAGIDWLIDASMDVEQLWVNLLGGEPLLAWDNVERLVPYAKRRAAMFGKAIQFGITSNLTLVTPEIIDFTRRFGMGWHCSIDGTPEVQDAQRPTAGRTPSHPTAERGACLVLGYRPNACARATITPRFVGKIYESLLYLESLGFVHFAFALADEDALTPDALAEFDQQWARVTDHVIRRYEEGRRLAAMGLDYMIQKIAHRDAGSSTCGAGRGTALLDTNGDLWPCHRWDGTDYDTGEPGRSRLGNIFGPGFDHDRQRSHIARAARPAQGFACDGCAAQPFCGGGCPAANEKFTGDVDRPHSNACHLMRALLHHAARANRYLTEHSNRLFLSTFYGDTYACAASPS